MNAALQTQAKAPTKPCCISINTSLAQRKCACGGSASLAGQCEECGKQKLSLRPSTQESIAREALNSTDEPLNQETRVEPGLGHHFSSVRIYGKPGDTAFYGNQPGSLSAGLAGAPFLGGAATAMEDEGKTDTAAFEGEPVAIQPEGPDQTPAPVNEAGLIDGEWTSEVAAKAFVNGGKTGTAIINWAGGAGGTTPNIGSVTSVAPQIDTQPAPDAGGTAQAWVRGGTGTATVSRSYTGSLVGANGPNYYITAGAAARIDRHEENHIAHSRTRHDASIAPLETRVTQRTAQANAISGATEAAARTALETFLDWNNSITSFRNGDNADNLPGGTVDTTDAASAGFYHDYGARTVAGVNYPHYVDIPPGP